MIQILVLTLTVPAVSRQGLAQGPSPAAFGQEGERSSRESGDTARLAIQAQEAMRKGDYPKAIERLEMLVKRAPGISEIHSNLASAYYAVGRFNDAAEQAQEALKLKPSLANAHFTLGLSLAEGGRCKEALPYLSKDYLRAPDLPMKRQMGTDGLRCAMNIGDSDKAIDLVRSLNHDFPDDPDLLFLSSHLFSDLSTQASQRLLMTAPGSYQAHQLNAEVLEIQGKFREAGDEYRKVLSLNPSLNGIHYELGRLLLAGDRGPDTLDEARREFEEELKKDPGNPAPEYELGEMARQARQWSDAIRHFDRATKLDPQFAEAFIGLGKSLVSAGRVQEAVAALERAVKLDPANPNAHYQLSFAYRRLGRDQEAAKELSVYRETHDKAAGTIQRIRMGIVGNIAQPQTDSPPE
ncbi:MAG: tetratricopeptide repeat protein [Terriglobia bacterium]